MPHRVLDVVAEHPQEQHVADEVKDIGVKEHVGEERCFFADRIGPSVNEGGASTAVPPSSSRGVTPKLATAASPSPLTSSRKTSTLTAISDTVTY